MRRELENDRIFNLFVLATLIYTAIFVTLRIIIRPDTDYQIHFFVECVFIMHAITILFFIIYIRSRYNYLMQSYTTLKHDFIGDGIASLFFGAAGVAVAAFGYFFLIFINPRTIPLALAVGSPFDGLKEISMPYLFLLMSIFATMRFIFKIAKFKNRRWLQ